MQKRSTDLLILQAQGAWARPAAPTTAPVVGLPSARGSAESKGRGRPSQQPSQQPQPQSQPQSSPPQQQATGSRKSNIFLLFVLFSTNKIQFEMKSTSNTKNSNHLRTFG